MTGGSYMCKRGLIILLAAVFTAVGCGSVGQYSNAGRFQDGIYYKAGDAADEFVPLSIEEINARTALAMKTQKPDTLVVAVVDADDLYWDSWCYRPYFWGCRPFGWYGYGWHNHFYDPYWYGFGMGYAWSYGWYDPYFYDPFWYDPYWYGGGHYHGGHYAYGHNVPHPGRTASSAGIVSRVPGTTSTRAAAPGSGVGRSVATMRRTAAAPRTTATNRAPASSGYEYRTPAATRGGNSASYNGPQRSSQPSYRQSEGTYRSSGGNYRPSGGSSFGGGGSYGGSHSSGGSMSHGGGGRR